jgi:hypothetical protein
LNYLPCPEINWPLTKIFRAGEVVQCRVIASMCKALGLKERKGEKKNFHIKIVTSLK